MLPLHVPVLVPPCPLTALSCPQSACGFPRHCRRLLVCAPSSPPCGPLGPCPVSAPIPLLLPDAFSTPFPLPSDLAQLSSMSALSVSPLGFLPLAAAQSITKGGWYPSSVSCPHPSLQGSGVPCTPAGLSRILLGHVLTRSGVSLLAQVRRTFRRSLELRPGSCPHCLGPNVGRGSETWFSRHAPGTLPRYSSRTHRLMPCLCLLVGEVWVHQGPWWGCLGGSIPSPRNPN